MAGLHIHTARHREVTAQFRLLTAKAETRRFAAQHLDVIGHMVVKSEVTDRHEIQAGFLLQHPMALAQLRAHGFQGGQIDLAAPMFFKREFQFPVRAHARKTQGVCMDHAAYLPIANQQRSAMVGQIQLLFKRKILPFNLKIIDSPNSP